MQILGISIDTNFLRLSVLEKSRNQVKISKLKTYHLQEEESVKLLYKTIQKAKITSCLDPKKIFMSSFDLNVTSLKYVDQMIAFHLETTSYLNPKDSISIYTLPQKKKVPLEVTTLTASKDTITHHLENLRKCRIEPEKITSYAHCVIEYIRFKHPQLIDAYILDIQDESVTCITLDQAVLKKTHTTDLAICDLYKALAEDRKKTLFQKDIETAAKQIDITDLKKNTNTSFSSQLNNLSCDISRALYSFSTKYGKKPLVIVGKVDVFVGVEEYFTEKLSDYITNCFDHQIPQEEHIYASSIGSALSFHNDLDFRKEEFFPRGKWIWAGKMTSLFVLGCLIVNAIFLMYCQDYFNTKISQSSNQYKNFLLKQDSSLGLKIFETKDPDDVLLRWQRALKTYAKDYPYILNIPNVSEILDWIYNLPLVKTKSDEKIIISEICYNIEEMPTILDPKASYKAKIEICFSSSNIIAIRKCLDYINTENAFIDHSQEIHYEESDSNHKVSFYLAPKKGESCLKE